jgi:hypothetical protein
MECLRDTITLLGCGATEPSSGRYVNDLPGISSYLFKKITNSEEITYLNTWNKIQDRALRKFNTEVIKAFRAQKSERIKTIAQTVDIGRIIDNTDPLPAAAQYRGFTVELMFPNNIYTLQSSLQVIYIQTVSVYSNVVATVDVKIVDLDTAEVLDTFPTDMIVGWNTIQVKQSYPSFRLFVGFDATAIDSPVMTIMPFATDGCQDCANWIYPDGVCTAIIRGALTADISDPSAIEQDLDCHGCSGVFSIQCRYDWLVCSNLAAFENAWQLMLGIETIWQLLHSERQNAFTTGFNRDEAQQLKDEFTSEFQSELSTVVDGIDIASGDCCVECESMIQKPYRIP